MTAAPLAGKRHLLFDLDGTLVDSNAAHAAAFVEALGPSHPDIAARFDYDAVRGIDTPAVLRRLGITEDAEVARLAELKRALYRARLARGDVALFPGATELFEALHAAGRVIVIVTSASRASAHTVLARTGLARFVAGVLAAEDVTIKKPSGAPLDLALARFGLARASALVVEDALDGVISARNAGIDAVVVHRAVPGAGVPVYATLRDLGSALGIW